MIRIVAREQKYRFDKNAAYQFMYIMHVDQYSKLDQAKVLEEASAHSGIAKGALKGAWDAIGEVIERHCNILRSESRKGNSFTALFVVRPSSEQGLFGTFFMK